MAGQHQDRDRVGGGLGHPGEGVLDAGAGLHQANTILVPVVDPGVAIGHVHRSPLHPADYRPDARGGAGINEGVVGEAKEALHPLHLQDVSYGGLTVHRSSSLLVRC